MKQLNRASGILLHISSLPGKFGIGSLGQEAYKFVDFLIEARQKLWQILPLGHTGYGDSPYQCYSAFAGNPVLINIEKLCTDGWLTAEEAEDNYNLNQTVVDYERVWAVKMPLLRKAAEKFILHARHVDKAKYERFCNESKFWIHSYALYIALKEHFGGKPWYHWDHHIKNKDYNTVNYYIHELRHQLEIIKTIQYFFYKQWLELKSYANINHIQIIGDIPLYVAYDSADAWYYPEIFQFNHEGRPMAVAGVPPDYFSETGQLWGNPLYNWEYLEKHNFSWWVERVKANFVIFDILRIDHFRGLSAYWSVPFGDQNAIHGKWINAPGKALLTEIFNQLGNIPVIAEDLGVITPEVEHLRDSFGLPGMKILQFAFDAAEENNFLPHTYTHNCIVYTGTHDNDTSAGWFANADEENKKTAKEYFNFSDKHFAHELVKLAWSTVAYTAIAPLQDILELSSDARMNLPGSIEGDWLWRYKSDDIKQSHIDFLKKITKIYSR